MNAGGGIEVRSECVDDHTEVRITNELAFGQPDEAAIVDRVRERYPGIISVVALDQGQVVGHILFSPVDLEPASPTIRVMGLGPMAVLPSHQRQGIGSRLVTAGLEACRAGGYDAVVVVGHPLYYPRFGFVPASRFGLQWPSGDPGEAFMALELHAGALGSGHGIVRYLPEFEAA